MVEVNLYNYYCCLLLVSSLSYHLSLSLFSSASNFCSLSSLCSGVWRFLSSIYYSLKSSVIWVIYVITTIAKETSVWLVVDFAVRMNILSEVIDAIVPWSCPLQATLQEGGEFWFTLGNYVSSPNVKLISFTTVCCLKEVCWMLVPLTTL